MNDIVQSVIKTLLGVVIAIGGYWAKESATATQALVGAVSDLRVIVAELRTSQQAAHSQMTGLERRVERLECRRKDRPPSFRQE